MSPTENNCGTALPVLYKVPGISYPSLKVMVQALLFHLLLYITAKFTYPLLMKIMMENMMVTFKVEVVMMYYIILQEDIIHLIMALV